MPTGDPITSLSTLCGSVVSGVNADLNNSATHTGHYIGSTWYPSQPSTPSLSWSYTYTPYPHEARIAELEGEVKVLREMVAALVGGGNMKPRTRRKTK